MSDDRDKRISPEGKKALSLDRDRRNTYGENDKASRKAIPAFKAASNRSARRKVAKLAANVVTNSDDGSDDIDVGLDVGLAEAEFEKRHPAKRKEPDEPLSLVLDQRSRKRTDGADRVKTKGRREAVRKVVEQSAAREYVQAPSGRGKYRKQSDE